MLVIKDKTNGIVWCDELGWIIWDEGNTSLQAGDGRCRTFKYEGVPGELWRSGGGWSWIPVNEYKEEWADRHRMGKGILSIFSMDFYYKSIMNKCQIVFCVYMFN